MNLNEKSMLDKLTLKYIITSNTEVAKEILDNFDIVDVINECHVIGIVYHAIKSEPVMIRYIQSRERLDEILHILKEEYAHNIEIVDVIRSLMASVDLLEQPYFIKHFIEFLNMTIKYFNSQSYEVTATIITESEIREMASYLLAPLKTLPMSSAIDYIHEVVNRDNCFYLMLEMNFLSLREVPTVFEDTITFISELLDIVSRFEDNDSDFDFENQDILEVISYSKNELIELCVKNIPIEIYDFDKLDFMKFLSTVRLLKMDYSLSKIVEQTVIKYITNIMNDLANIKNKRQEAVDTIFDIQYISELDYRIPRVLYLTSDSFEIVDFLEDPVLHVEYKVLKDLEIIEQTYRDYTYDTGQDYSKQLFVNWKNMDKLIPIDYIEEDRDSIITSV